MNRTPFPGAPALEARLICDELTRNVGLIARHGISDWALVDSAVRALARRLIVAQHIDGPEAEAIIRDNLDIATRSRLRNAA